SGFAGILSLVILCSLALLGSVFARQRYLVQVLLIPIVMVGVIVIIGGLMTTTLLNTLPQPNDLVVQMYKHENLSDERYLAQSADELDEAEVTAAITAAQWYAQTYALSKAGVYEHLLADEANFSLAVIEYVVQTLTGDWAENARKKAESLRELMNLTPEQIYEQLISSYGDKFTASEARYAIEHLTD
ncbi:MAG: Ltp family lipoprotein, partial [Culicoidibacterales bacterium]